jgi:hypothetical protein
MGNIRKLGAFVAFAVTLVAVSMALPSMAGAAPVASVFDGKIPCTVQPSGVRYCSGTGGAVANTVNSFDGTPIDVNFALPDEAQFGPGPYPLAMYFHGFGGGKEGFTGDLQRFTNMGIAAFSMTDRGFKDSCGKAPAIAALELAGEDCSNGFIHLMDTRFEVRDAQYLAGMLVDDGVVIPNKIGSVGASYGGTKSIALAALKNRVMMPDGSLAPWTSPEGTPMELAASAPIVPPSDFAAALVPNGRTLEYMLDAPYGNTFGVMKIGIINGLIDGGDNFYDDGVGTDAPGATWDILGWKAMMEAGEPYAGGPLAQFMVDEMTLHHSAYYIDDSVKPAPLLIAEGLTDDLFPINEALRYYNRTKSTWPGADMSLLFADIGHPRAPLTGEFEQGRPADKELGFQRVESWFEYYQKDEGKKPVNGVEARSQMCPYEEPSGGPFTGPNWAAMSPGELRLTDPRAQVIEPDAGDRQIGSSFSIVNNACTQKTVKVEPGTLTYSFGTVPAGGYTLMGAPTVISQMSVANGSESQVAARLWEISDGKQRLIARGIYRPDASGPQVFQLNGNVYKFEPGTEIQLQLVPKDAGYAPLDSSFRASNDQQAVAVSDVEIRLPLAERPGSRKGVKKPMPKVLPSGAELALDYKSIGSISIGAWARNKVGTPVLTRVTARGRNLTATLNCPARLRSCATANLTIRGARNLRRGRNAVLGRKAGIRLSSGSSRTVSIRMTRTARKLLGGRKAPKKLRATWQMNGGGTGSRGSIAVIRKGRVR